MPLSVAPGRKVRIRIGHTKSLKVSHKVRYRRDMRNRRKLFLLVLLVLCVLLGCSGGKKEKNVPSSPAQSSADAARVAEGRVGVMTGSVAEFFIVENYPKTRLKSYENITDAITALQGRKLDYVITAYTNAVNALKNNQDLAILPGRLLSEEVAIGVAMGNRELVTQLNDVLARFKKDGSLDKLIARWIKADNSPYDITPIPVRKDGKVLRVAVCANREPMNFVRNNTYMGLDCELIQRITYELGMRVEFHDMYFSALINALQSGKVDVVISNMSATKERKEKVRFTEKYFDNPQVVVVKKTALAPGITDVSQLAGKKVGILTGSSWDRLAGEQIPGADLEYFNSFTDQVSALQAGKIAGFLVDEPIARDIMNNTSGMACIKKPLRADGYAFAFPQERAELRGQVDAILKAMTADGTLKKLDAKWFGKDEAAKTLPDISSGAPGKEVIRLATYSGVPPFAFTRNGKTVGYDIEIVMMIASKLGRGLEIQNMEPAAIIPSLVSGKSDIAAACIAVTEERAKSVLFSVPDYKGGVVVMVAAGGSAAESGGDGLWTGFIKSFQRTFMTEDRYKMVFRGLGVTIVISLLSAALGTILGFGVCMMRRAGSRWANIPAKIYIRAVQGTPIVVLLMILYYIVFGGLDISGILVAVIGFSLNFAAYVSEMMRTGIDAVDKGQHEAAYALGFNRIQVFTKITFPQAARHVLPVFKGEFISMVKMTSIVGYIAIQDLTKVSDIIRSRTYEAFFPLIATALIYFVIAYGMTYLLSRIEMKVDPKRRQRVVKGLVRP